MYMMLRRGVGLLELLGKGREVTGQEREKGGRVVLMVLGLSEKACDSIKSNRQCENTGLGVGPANK